MKGLVNIVDYGMGNLFSVAKAVEHCGGEARVSDMEMHVRGADYLILPGVGAFADAMQKLRQQGLVEAIRDFCQTGRPFLGICLGMQMMFEWSEEFGIHHGIGLLPGRVVPIDKIALNGAPHKIPHIGWTPICAPLGRDSWKGTILKSIEESTEFYFVHSFTASPEKAEHRLADAEYNGRKISAAVRSGNLYGCQFHPEKSGKAGLRIIEDFLLL